MQATHTREFWKSRWDDMIKWVPGDQYMNLEDDLAREMKCIDECIKAVNSGITDEQYDTIRRIKAQSIIEKATAKCKEQMDVVRKVKAGEVSLGGITESQRVRFKYDYFSRFEFNCYQLAVFREKYSLKNNLS